MLDPERVVVALACSDLEDAIDVAAIRLATDGGAGSAAAIASAIMTRERACSTAVGAGLALPHAIVRDADPRAVVVTLRKPLATDTPDGVPLKMLVVHVHPGRPEHRRVLAELARLAEPSLIDTASSRRAASQVVRDLTAFLERA
jgi:PTS system nitrogen regulatory IIA component